MSELDQIDFDAADPQGMGSLIARFPETCEEAWENIQGLDLPEDYRQVEHVLVLGMGGSAIGGDLLRVLTADQCRVPILVSREYDVPAWVDERTLAIASSHSGGTEETLSAFEQVRARGAKLLAITSGGDLERDARAAGAPVLTYEFKGQPRAALAYSMISLIGIASRLGFIQDPTSDLEQALTAVRELQQSIAPNVPEEQNRAKRLARQLYDRVPIIYGAGLLGEVAHRWKTQMNENAKVTAGYELMSEFNHNAVVGYEFPRELLKSFIFVMLESKHAGRRIRQRFEATRELLDRRGLEYEVVTVEGANALGEMLWGIHLGDFVSYYLALLNHVDPTPVEAIDLLKNALAS